MGRYTNIFHIDEWPDRLRNTQARLDRPYSIVYKLFSRKTGRVRYVGRSDNPRIRVRDRMVSLEDFNWSEDIECQVVFAKFTSFTGRNRFRRAFEEECRQFHQWIDIIQNEVHPQRKHVSWNCPVEDYNCP